MINFNKMVKLKNIVRVPPQDRLHDWNEVYKIWGKLQYKKDSLISKEVVSLFKKYNVRKILDLGCGTGRYSFLFAKKKFKVVGIDIAEVAINISAETSQNQKVCFFPGDMKDIKFPNNYFDAVFCFLVIHHGKIYEIWKAFDEITRVLKEGKILFISLPSIIRNKHIFEKGVEIEPGTYVNLDCLDGMVPHHFFKKKEMLALFKGRYRILKIEQRNIFIEHEGCSWNYYLVSAQKKEN